MENILLEGKQQQGLHQRQSVQQPRRHLAKQIEKAKFYPR